MLLIQEINLWVISCHITVQCEWGVLKLLALSYSFSHRCCYQIENDSFCSLNKLINKPIVSIYPSISTHKHTHESFFFWKIIIISCYCFFLSYKYKIDFNLLPLSETTKAMMMMVCPKTAAARDSHTRRWSFM